MNFSYWERQFISDKADLVIIGGGISGLSAAYFASQRFPNWKIVVLEKFSISTAASTRNAGFSCFGSAGEIIDDLSSTIEPSQVFETLKMRYDGLTLLKETLGENSIGYEECGGTELFSSDQSDEFHQISENLDSLNSEIKSAIGLDDTFSICSTPNSLNGFKSAIFNRHEGKLNPGLMVRRWRTLCEENGVEIHNGVEARLEKGSKIVKLKNHAISANQIAVCTNGLTRDLGLSLDVNPARNLVLLTKPLASLNLTSSYHHMKGYIYFREIHNRLLIGGGRHLFKDEEFTSEFSSNQNVKKFLLEYLERHFSISSAEVEQEWTGIMGVSKSKETIIKRLDDNLVCGVKLGGMGVAIGSIVGRKVADLL